MAYFSVPIKDQEKNKTASTTAAGLSNARTTNSGLTATAKSTQTNSMLSNANTGSESNVFGSSGDGTYTVKNPVTLTKSSTSDDDSLSKATSTLSKPAASVTASTGSTGSGSSTNITGDEVATWVNPYQQQRDDLFDQIMNPSKFSYDLYQDDLYRQYKQQYETLGKQAMQDTMGQASALTGGYGSTYAQAAGQQSYYDYLNKLNDVVPTLRENAYNEWSDQEDRKLDQYQLALDAYNAAADEQSTAYSNLAALIQSGYVPSDAELEQAGMTKAQARLYEPSSGSGSGSGSSSTTTKTGDRSSLSLRTAHNNASKVSSLLGSSADTSEQQNAYNNVTSYESTIMNNSALTDAQKESMITDLWTEYYKTYGTT